MLQHLIDKDCMTVNLKFFMMLFIIPLASCSSTTNTLEKFKVSNFRQGLVDVSGRSSKIYAEGDRFPYEINGSCVSNSITKPCMWHGFEFFYESPSYISKIYCKTKSTTSLNQVYPGAVIAKNVTEFEWGFVLKGKKGQYLRPQYSISPPSTDKQPLTYLSQCYFNDEEIFNYEFTVLY